MVFIITTAKEAAFTYLVPHIQKKYVAEEGATTEVEDIKEYISDMVPKEIKVTQEFLQRLVSQTFPQSPYDEAELYP